jgi:hypothetical protein
MLQQGRIRSLSHVGTEIQFKRELLQKYFNLICTYLLEYTPANRHFFYLTVDEKFPVAMASFALRPNTDMATPKSHLR